VSPVRPAAVGTFTLPALGAQYTIGRDHVGDAACYLARYTDTLAVDIETEGLGRAAMNVKAVTIASRDHAVILDPRDPLQAEVIRRALSMARGLVLHRTCFDVPILARHGLLTVGDGIAKVVDTLIYCRLAEPDERTRKSLDHAAARYLGTSTDNLLKLSFRAAGMRSQTEGFRQFDLDRPVYVHGAAIDGIVTARLLPLARTAALSRLTEGHPFTTYGVTGDEALRLLDREQIVNRLFLRRSARGLRVDLDRLDAYREQVGEQQAVDHAILDEAGVVAGNTNSLTGWLDERGLIPADYPRTPKTDKPSGLADNLERIYHPIAAAFVRVKQTDKVLNDYLTKVVDLADEHDRVHPEVSILGAATGRSSMSDPPFHQFPPDARGIVLADEGDEMTSIDWSQIEPVTAANVARDLPVLQGYEDGTSDLYTEVARMAGITRKAAKVVVLALLYGQGLARLAAGLSQAVGEPVTVEQARKIKDTLFATMPLVKRMIYRIKDVAERHRMIFTLSGRIVPVPMSTWEGRSSVATHKAVNYFVQGSAADLLAEALVEIEAQGLGDAVYLAMHDELVVSTSAAEQVQKIMSTPPERLCRMAGRVPILRTDRADLGERWAAA
jgi:DNA polymerase family A/3'-5' exonuclease